MIGSRELLNRQQKARETPTEPASIAPNVSGALQEPTGSENAPPAEAA
jgi:hypothetical protein